MFSGFNPGPTKQYSKWVGLNNYRSKPCKYGPMCPYGQSCNYVHEEMSFPYSAGGNYLNANELMMDGSVQLPRTFDPPGSSAKVSAQPDGLMKFFDLSSVPVGIDDYPTGSSAGPSVGPSVGASVGSAASKEAMDSHQIFSSSGSSRTFVPSFKPMETFHAPSAPLTMTDSLPEVKPDEPVSDSTQRTSRAISSSGQSCTRTIKVDFPCDKLLFLLVPITEGNSVLHITQGTDLG